MRPDQYWPWSPSTTKNLRVIEAVTRSRLWGSDPHDYLVHLRPDDDHEELPVPPLPPRRSDTVTPAPPQEAPRNVTH